MSLWKKTPIIDSNGTEHHAIAPVILSASRATDIPAFYGEWFINRLKAGYSLWKNPFGGNAQYISFNAVRAIIFWTKNPKAFLKYLQYIEEQKLNYYFLFTLNDYEKEGYELHLPSVTSRVEYFIELSERIGKERVLWRFDPLILSDKISLEQLFRKIESLGTLLVNHTDKLIFSFVDIEKYRKVAHSIKNHKEAIREFTEAEKILTASFLQTCLQQWRLHNEQFQIALCGQEYDFSEFDIRANACIDAPLLQKLFPGDKALNEFINTRFTRKDTGQRAACNCFFSKDIGHYNSCPHGCIYCYANTSITRARNNYSLGNPFNESLL